MIYYLYDESRIRYTLVDKVSQMPSAKPYNWLFLPGGPGSDSSYLRDLTSILDFPGNAWLIDLPGNGSNIGEINNDFEEWFNIFLDMVKRFKNPILVGHSFGGMFPLLFPKLEEILKGLIILNAAPSSPLAESEKCAKINKLPDLSKAMSVFHTNPTQENFNNVLDACFPYYFSANYLDTGKKALGKIEIHFRPSLWWSKKIENYNATWVPQKVPTLIVGGDCDYVTPFSIFEQDQRFKRKNISLKKINHSGHFPWIDQPHILKNIWMDFIQYLC